MKKLNVFASIEAIALLFALIFVHFVQAQSSVCGQTSTSNDFQQYAQRLNTPTAQNGILNSNSIPIHFWVIRYNDGYFKDNSLNPLGSPSSQDIDNLLGIVNSNFTFTYNNQFVRCGLTYINNDNFTVALSNQNTFFTQLGQIQQNYFNPKAINIYVVQSVATQASFPWGGNYITISRNHIDNPNIVLHELGHFFGLYHTHEGCTNSATREQVVRDDNNCRFKGDLLCSTEAYYGDNGKFAPPTLRSGDCNNYPQNCPNPNCTVKDDNNITLIPQSTRNFMGEPAFCNVSYSFTNEQFTRVMNSTLYNDPNRNFLISNSNICSAAPVTGIIENLCAVPLRAQNIKVNLTYQNGTSPCYSPSTQTNNVGEYFTCNLNTSNSLTLNPTKTTDWFNGVSTFDIGLIQQHILDIAPLSNSYKKLAADVNNDGYIDAIDMVLIRNLILRRITSFADVGSWRFVPKFHLSNTGFSNLFNNDPFSASYTINGQTFGYLGTNSYMDKVTHDLSNSSLLTSNNWSFIGVKMGDVNCSVNPATTFQNLSTRSFISYENANNKSIALNPNEEKTILLKAKYNGNINNWQVGFKFASNKLTVTSVEKGDFNSANDVHDYTVLNGSELRALWYNEKAKNKDFKNNVTLMKFKVKALTTIPDLISELKLDPATLTSEFYNESMQLAGVDLTLEWNGNSTPIGNGSYSVKAYPNPFSSSLTFDVTTPVREKATLTISNPLGLTIYQTTQQLEIGTNTITVPNAANFPTGLLSYSVKLNNTTLTGTVNKTR